MFPYASARSRAQLVDVLLSAQLALWTLRLVGGLWRAVSRDDSFGVMFARGARLSEPFLLVLFIGTAIAMLFWLDRAARNLPALRAPKPIASEHVVGVFFAPLFNLAAIPYVVRHVWRGSDPTPPRRRWLLATWWAPLLAAPLSIDCAPLTAALVLVSAASLIAIVRDTQRRQDEQFKDEVLRGEVPLPTGELLR